MRDSTEILNNLGLLYDATPLPIIESSVEPNLGVLNVDKALNDNPECWDTIIQAATQHGKKTIILNCGWDPQTYDGYNKYIILSKLINDGFNIYYQSDNGLEKLSDPDQIESALPAIKPISPSELSAEIIKLNSTADRVELFNESRFNELCKNILSSKEAYLYFHCFLEIENASELYPELDYSEEIITNYNTGIEWHPDKPQLFDTNTDWQKKQNQFNKRIQLKINQQKGLSTQSSTNCKDTITLENLKKEYPDLLKKLTYVSLSNKAIAIETLVSFLNQTSNLLSLTIQNCEQPSSDDMEEMTSLRNTSLRYVDIAGYAHNTDLVSSILHKSPNLRGFCIRDSALTGISDLKIQQMELPNLRFVLFDKTKLPLKQLNNLVTAAPNLTRLHLLDIQTDDWEPDISFKHVVDLLSSTPKIEDLALSQISSEKLIELLSVYQIEVHEFINSNDKLEEFIRSKLLEQLKPKGLSNYKIDKSFNKLETINLNRSFVLAEQLFPLLNTAPNLCNLVLSHCIIIESDKIALHLNTFPLLKKLDLSASIISNECLMLFLKAAPNLNELSLKKPDNFLKFLQILSPNTRSSLSQISFPEDVLSSSDLTQLLEIFPNLTSVSFIEPRDEKQKKAISWFQLSYPHIKISFTPPPEDTLLLSIGSNNATSKTNATTLDGNIGKKDKALTLPARTLFKAKNGKNPSIHRYQLEYLSWRYLNFYPSGALETYLVSIPQSNLNNEQLQELFNSSSIPEDHVYGQLIFELPPIHEWLQLPALSTNDELKHYAADHEDYEIKKDRISGYYYIRFNKPTKSCLVNYIIKPGNNKDETLDSKVSKVHLEWLAKCSFGSLGRLINNEEYQKLLQLDVSQRIQLIASYCRFDKEAADKDIPGNTVDVLNGLMKERAGVCRHRAMLFVALANSLNVNAVLIQNDVHSFVRIMHKASDYTGDYTIDLGGGAADLVNLPMPTLPKERALKSKQTSKRATVNVNQTTLKPVTLNPSNRFQTWNSQPIVAENAEELVKKLVSKEAKARQWVIFKDPQGIESLHQASTANEKNFFSRDLDSLVLQSTHIDENGKDKKMDSPVSQFLKKATLSPNESFTWFVNWSAPKARHVGLNSVIDNEGRNLGGLAIPSNVHIVVCMDEQSASKMGDDFYSRFDAISQAPLIPPVDMPDIKKDQLIGKQDVVFPTPMWESILFGRHTFDEGNLGIYPGALLKAAQEKTSKLILHNAPFADPKFRFFIREVQASKRFFFNGEWHSLPKDFQFVFATPDLSQYPTLIAPKVEPKHTRVVNQTTLPQFFNQFTINKNKSLTPKPGFFAVDSSLTLIVNDNLSEIQWFTLLKEANEKQCALSIKATPGVFVPPPLKGLVTAIEPLTSSNKLIVATDLDDAEEHYKTAESITINVDPKTNFNGLFFHVSLKNRQFTGEETALLEAIKKGNPVILKGHFSKILSQQLQTLFTRPSSLWVNGEPVPVNNLTIVTNDATPFNAILPTSRVYQPDDDFKKMDPELALKLKNAYEELHFTPCHSHFTGLPKDKKQQSIWLGDLISRLQLRAGIFPKSTKPTSPETIIEYLDAHSFAFLISKTGAGKSHFVQKTLPEYGKNHNKPIKIYHEIAHLKDWLQHKENSQPILFLDEANITNEHYLLFEALARGDEEFWFEGECYPLKNHKVIFAGNPIQYEGRFEPDLLKHFPNYLFFQGQPLSEILQPLLQQYAKPNELLALIETYYQKAQDARLNITPRNAQMMCLRFFILKESYQTKLMPDDFLMRYAILSEIKTLSLDQDLSKTIRKELKQSATWKVDKKNLKEATEKTLPKTNDKKFIWTASRQKIAFAIETLMLIREKKIQGKYKQEEGINGLILEGEPGLGKSQLFSALLKAKGIDFVFIAPTNPVDMQTKLLDAFHKGQVVVIDEFNTLVHEKLLNALLSGYDLDGNPPNKPGFCLIGTQNPVTFHDRQPLSKALENRLMHLKLSHYKKDEFKTILTEKFQLNVKEIQIIIDEYFTARKYSRAHGLFPPPNSRNMMNRAEERQKEIVSNAIQVQ